MKALNVNSEIGRLKTVLLHEPQEELNNLTPELLNELLFDDIPWLPLARIEHKAFQKALIDEGVDIIYLVDAVSEALSVNSKIRNDFILEFVSDSNVVSDTLKEALIKYLKSFKDNKELVLKCIAGIKKEDIKSYKNKTLTDLIETSSFITNPMPNLYFTRDPFVIIGSGVALNKMYSETRRRETIFGKYIFKYHPKYKNPDMYYDRDYDSNIEGGDILVLNKETLIVGSSERTSPRAIETLAKNLFFNKKADYKRIIVLSIKKQRACMHLDTVLTQVDYDKFAIHEDVSENLEIYLLEKDINKENKLKATKLNQNLQKVLTKYIGKEVVLIPCGGSDLIAARREQWSDASNTLCISPGVVIAYERNDITNKILSDYGIKVITIPSSELSRGRGGPRCMSMPLEREDI